MTSDEIERIASTLLANTVIEDYDIVFSEVAE